MGLYDTITVHYPLPDVAEMPPEGVMLQTKSFDRWLDGYTLTAEGRLFYTSKCGGKEIEPPWLDMDWHGDIETAEGYTIRMTEGSVAWIKRT